MITTPLVSTSGRRASSEALAFSGCSMRTCIYIDGFNLYYGALKGTPYKWLDLKVLLTRILQPHHLIIKIKYFTARVSASPGDSHKPIRQQSYLRALVEYVPEIEIIYGHFLSHEINAPLANPGLGNPRFVRVIKTEEKGSDVNLAVHLLNDAWMDVYDCAVVISNDSDLAESMRLVRQHHCKRIGLVTPGKSYASRQLIQHADFKLRIREGALKHSLLPDTIPGTTLHKPVGW